ncbi:amidohydrolase (plasmid) [Sinorhizobium meliloti]|nr:amidohydrolase [Sinorhizobium meliloti]
MDALPIVETSNKPWASKTSGIMHACGHDGHTAMLLGAAKHLARSRNFKGSVALIFQPAEEPAFPTGAFKMVQEGIMDRFESRRFSACISPRASRSANSQPGTVRLWARKMISISSSRVGGGHAAEPSHTIDPVVIAAQIILGLQTLVSRKTDSLESLVISVTKLNAAQAYNIIPDQVEIGGTVRTFASSLRDFAEREISASAQGIARGFGAEIEFKYLRSVPATFNSTEETDLAIQAARNLVGVASVDEKVKFSMGAEDFAYMLEARPGAYNFLGNGPTAECHNPAFDFDDEALPFGIGYWVQLVETVLGSGAGGRVNHHH